LLNNALWLVLFTLLSVGLGLLLAVLAGRVRYESVAKAVIFIPMAISFVAAAVIWRFVYAFQPEGFNQIGLANAIGTSAGLPPVAWLVTQKLAYIGTLLPGPLHTNNFAVIVVGVWMWTGFAMVILSASLKGISREILEAARVDGATEWQIFWRIILPLISPTVAVVATTLIIQALKKFDIVWVMTAGNYGTDVVATLMYKEMFNFRDFGVASALAVILLIAMIPVMLVTIRRFRAQEETR
jgi:alpha-glucoside transport system permease protein